MPPCEHAAQIRVLEPSEHVCQACVAQGDGWVHLRMCLECGHVGCCDASKNKHATAHHHATGHPLIRSIEPGDHWVWCYVHEIAFRLPQDAAS